ncbi:sugar phosphate isomerase/epimerase [Pradoshia sp. D12]|uniref:sugar phosphate isomerase/epimerase family protein n=1 Tax=Bacillaceae TaxID=186817 RepID=UPI001129203C|nr:MULTISPECIES: sugar phosphate isomerase/epimerase [Bacillaceae]QFK72461.1 sugar phosphate isomerase/epimerase [Pradoshia sp. D12]TPF70795.1 sugar phosphate isomerase/epimerase [Bacillus sp. D12]
MNQIPIAVQMFSLREEAEKNFAGTLKKVAELGFDGVELAGYGKLTAQEVRNLLDEYGLKAAASHIPIDELESELERVIEEQIILGSNYIVCPYLAEDRRKESEYLALPSLLNEIGETCKRNGLTLCYHNHDFELETLSDGRKALEVIFDGTDPDKVKAEFDVYWLKKAGEDPISWLDKYRNRSPLIHLKDMTLDDEQFFAELGTGGVEIEKILEKGEELNVAWWIVEQDATRLTPFRSMEISMNYLKSNLPDYTTNKGR